MDAMRRQLRDRRRALDPAVQRAASAAVAVRAAPLLEGIRKYRDRFGPMHWEPAPLLEELVTKGMTIADWERARAEG